MRVANLTRTLSLSLFGALYVVEKFGSWPESCHVQPVCAQQSQVEGVHLGGHEEEERGKKIAENG